MKYYSSIFYVLLNCTAFGQTIIKGSVSSLSENAPIPYCNIGILNTVVGTMSDEKGLFVLNIPERFDNDTLIFSALGYVPQKETVKSLRQQGMIAISLADKKMLLQSVTVVAHKVKNKTFELGNRYAKGGVNLCSNPEATTGASVALFIENKGPAFRKDLVYPLYVDKGRVRIADNTTGEFKVRVRLYGVDPGSGLPGDDMLSESIIIKSTMKQGWLEFDLSRLKLVVDGPFYIAFEWILDKSERQSLSAMYREFESLHPDRVKTISSVVDGKEITTTAYINFLPGTSFGVSTIPVSLNDYKCVYRSNSMGTWNRAGFILTSRVVLANELKDSITQSTAPK